MSTNMAALSAEQTIQQFKALQLAEQQATQQQTSQQTLSTDQGKVLTNIDKDEPLVKKGDGQGSQKPVSGEYAFLAAMAGMMDTNLDVMGSQAKNAAALEPQIYVLNEQLSALQAESGNTTGSAADALVQATAVNMQLSIVNAQLNNDTTSMNQNGSMVSTISAENNQDAGLAQSMLQYAFVQQVI